MTTTTQLRDWWSPPCEGPFVKIALYGRGTVSVTPEIADAVHALSACLEAHSYETRAADTGAYNCRRITGGTGYSLHAYGVAIDVNWLTNPYGPTLETDMPSAMVAAIKAIRTTTGKQVWRWGGDYAGNKDAMHFEITCHPADLLTGIDPDSLPHPQPHPAPPPSEDDDMPLIIKADGKPARLLDAPVFVPLDSGSYRNLKAAGVREVEVTAADYDEIRGQILRALG